MLKIILLCFYNSFVNLIPYDILKTEWTSIKSSGTDPLNTSCFCDKISFTCDPFCCCDEDCGKVIINVIKLGLRNSWYYILESNQPMPRKT
jgi:hypothetical protein